MLKNVVKNLLPNSFQQTIRSLHQKYKYYHYKTCPPHFKTLNIPSPKEISLAFTFQCRAQCPHCYLLQGKMDIFKNKSEIEKSFVEEIFKSQAAKSIRSLVCGGGEALLHPDLFELLDIPVSAGIKDIQIVTNGMSLVDDKITSKIIAHQDKFNNLQISLDATNHDDYVLAKGIKICGFEKMCKNIQKITGTRRASSSLKVVASFVIHPKDRYKIFEMVSFSEKLGVDACQFLNLHVVSYSGHQDDSHLQENMPVEYLKLMEAKSFNIDIYVQPPMIDKYSDFYCSSLDGLLFIDPIGRLAPCSHIPWNEKYGVFDEYVKHNLYFKEKVKMKQQFVEAYKKRDWRLLPETCQFCNKRASGWYVFDSNKRKWLYHYWH